MPKADAVKDGLPVNLPSGNDGGGKWLAMTMTMSLLLMDKTRMLMTARAWRQIVPGIPYRPLAQTAWAIDLSRPGQGRRARGRIERPILTHGLLGILGSGTMMSRRQG